MSARSLITRVVCVLVALIAVASAAGGQTPATPPPAQRPPAPESAPTPPPNYAYAPDGRRDPFVSLVNRGTDSGRSTQANKVRPQGLAGVLVEEVVVQGIVQSRGQYVAQIKAPTGKVYSIRAGDRLMDGSVRGITGDAVILMQEINDPLRLEKQREVRKYLRGEVK